MGRIYSANFAGVAVTAAQDLFEVNAPADAVVVLHEIKITQRTKSTVERLIFSIQRSTGSSGSGGSTPTANPLAVGDPAFGGTVEANNTTRATTLTLLHQEDQDCQVGLHYLPTPEDRILLSPSGRIIVGLEVAPAASMTFEGSIKFEEIGG